ncbi:phage adaptor protein [Comamonas testosteroni]|uniref:phage adaptor protein n=1 Tax=Comamonas testosteroni TaxID=285 RepID=UPI0006B9E95A|nr:hypothetical protein [Comamonas testosteroni]
MTFVVPVASAPGAASSANLESLSKSVARWLNRTDLADVIPDFVRMSEAEFARDTRIRSSFQVVVVDGYTPNGEIPLPTDLLELQSLRLKGVEQFERKDFVRVGEVLAINGKPAGSYQMQYLQKLPALSFPSDSNWLLREHYDVYLWKCCEQGSVWMRDIEATQGYNGKYEAAVQQLLKANNYHAWGGAPIAVQAPGVV